MVTTLDILPPPPSLLHAPREWLLLLRESYNTTLKDPGSFPINPLIRPTHRILFSISAIYFHGINRSHSPQIISNAQRVTWKKQLNAPWLTCFSSLPTNMFACSFMTSKKSPRIVKWKVGVNIFLLERHLFPVLKAGHIIINSRGAEPQPCRSREPSPVSAILKQPPPGCWCRNDLIQMRKGAAYYNPTYSHSVDIWTSFYDINS